MLRKKTLLMIIYMLIMIYYGRFAQAGIIDKANHMGNNSLSLNEVNAIQFDSPIEQIHYPGQQILIDSNHHPVLRYTNKQKTIVFLLSKTIKVHSPIQFMVSLKNGKLLSLHFKAEKVSGRIFHILVPQTSLSQSELNQPKQLFNQVMQQVLIGGKPSGGWHVSMSQQGWLAVVPGLFQKLEVSWKKPGYQLEKWQICSKSHNLIQLNLFNSSQTVSRFLNPYPVDQLKLKPGHCIYWIQLKIKKNRVSHPLPVEQPILSPYPYQTIKPNSKGGK